VKGTAMQLFHTHRDTARNWAWAMLGTAAVLALFMLAGVLDASAEQRQEIAVHRAFIEGFKAGEASMIHSAEGAWQAAQEEARQCDAVRQRGLL
jgi:hypothetical protein